MNLEIYGAGRDSSGGQALREEPWKLDELAPSPFFHTAQLERLSMSEAQMVFLSGGRALGKSTVLTRLRDQLADDGQTLRGQDRAAGPVSRVSRGRRNLGIDPAQASAVRRDARLIAGRQHHRALTELEEVLRKPSGSLLIDDFDLFILNLRDDDTVPIKELLSLVSRAFVATRGRGGSVVVTSRKPESEFSASVNTAHQEHTNRLLGCVLNYFEAASLNPWSAGWRKSLSAELRAFLRHVSAEGPEGAPRSAHAKRTVEETEIELMVASLLEVSGGHPLVLGAAIDELEPRLRDLLNSGAVHLQSRWEPLWRDLEDTLMLEPAQILRTIIRQLRDSPSGEGRAAFEALTVLAGAPRGLPSIGSTEREVLRREGLLYYDIETGTYRIPGSILKECIRREMEGPISSGIRPVPIFELVADPVRPNEAGRLEVRRDGQRFEVQLQKSSWMLSRALHEAGGRPVSLAALKALMGTDDETMVRSALQRLREKLRYAGVDDLLGNVRGEGYYLESGRTTPSSPPVEEGIQP